MRRCAICGLEVTTAEHIVPSSDGLVVHIACADREATRAWQRRCLAASIQGIIGVLTLLCLWSSSGSLVAVGLLMSSLLVLHVSLNRRWWLTIAHWFRRSSRRERGRVLRRQ